MLILTESRFLPIPHTGSSWITQVLIESLKESKRDFATQPNKAPFYPWVLAPGRGLYTFSFVRNPFTWYQAYWIFGREKGWDNLEVNAQLREATFSKFVDLMLEKSPGLATDIFKATTNNWDIEFIGTTETVQSDLHRLLFQINEGTPKVWPNPESLEIKVNDQKYDLSYTPDQKESILLADAETFEKFNHLWGK